MNKRMRIMIAYDGSGYADTAIDDLRSAGLPQEGDAIVISIADISKASLAPSCEMGILGKYSSTALLEETITLMQREKSKVRNKATNLAIRGGKRLFSNFPAWRVRSQIGTGNLVEELLKKADEFKPDLIVLGSHGRSAIGRFFLGSVSKDIAEKADCSVRITRQITNKALNAPNKVIIGASSLPDVEEVVRAVRKRRWFGETEIRLVVADDGVSVGRVSAVYPYADAIFEQAVEELRSTGALVSVVIKSGETESILLNECAVSKAHSIFIANEKADKEKNLGNLATNLITGSKCTVEIVK